MTLSSLLVQSTLCTSVADGSARSAAWQEAGKPRFQFPHCAPRDLRAGPCVLFTSRHEQLHASSDPQVRLRRKTHDTDAQSIAPDQGPSDDASPQSSDSEAEAVKAWAALHHSSDDEAAESSEPVLWVCNGPWSALRRVTSESAANYSAEGSADASLLKPRCGCKIGVAALAIISSHPTNPCRRVFFKSALP